MSHQSENCRSVCACVISTPFGAPVVPEVNSTSLTSSPPTARDAGVDGRVVDLVARRLELAERLVAARAVVEADHERHEVRELGAELGQRRRVVDAEELADGEHDPRAAAFEDVAHLFALEPRVHRDHRATGTEDAERGDQPLVPVGRPDRGPLARLEPGAISAAVTRRASATSSVNVIRRPRSTTAIGVAEARRGVERPSPGSTARADRLMWASAPLT